VNSIYPQQDLEECLAQYEAETQIQKEHNMESANKDSHMITHDSDAGSQEKISDKVNLFAIYIYHIIGPVP
jgi:hypothetical protein